MENPEITEKTQETPIEELLLDTKMQKYKLISIAARWIEEISKKEEYKYLTFNQRLEVALRDILTGKVPIEEIQKLPPIDRRISRAAASPFPMTAKKPAVVTKEKKEDEPEKKKKKK